MKPSKQPRLELSSPTAACLHKTPLAFAKTPDDRRWDSSAFEAFAASAVILEFGQSQLPLPRRRDCYNDDIHLEHFQISARHYVGKQRRVVTDEHLECLSLEEHLDKALHSPFFLPLSVPLPGSILQAAEFIRDSNPEHVALFWEAHLNRLGGVVEASRATHLAWANMIPEQTAPSAGKLQLPALMSLAVQCGIGGSFWLQKFLFGFPLIGRLAQPRCYPTKPKEARRRAEPISKALKSSDKRFSERARNSGFKNAKALWAEALEQCDKGWLNRPFPLCAEKGPRVLSNPELNIAFRFGVEQGEKLRACDDLRFSRANLSCVVGTSIKLVSWDHLAELSHAVNDESRDWSFSPKADHEAAYKQPPSDFSCKACGGGPPLSRRRPMVWFYQPRHDVWRHRRGAPL